MARLFGVALMLASLGYVGWSLYTAGLFASSAWQNEQLWMRALTGGGAYGACLGLIGLGWTNLIRSVTEVRLGVREGMRIYALSHLLKYLPTNVLHYAGRQFLLSKRGVEHSAAAWASLIEAALIILASSFVATAFGLSHLASMLNVTEEVLLAALASVVSVTAAVFLVVANWSGRALTRFRRYFTASAGRAIAEALVLYIAFFAAAGGALTFLADGLLHDTDLSLMMMAASGAWVLGFVTPGASAGVGVREAAMIALLTQGGVANAEAGLLAIAYRVATTIGDVAFAGLAALLKPSLTR